MAKKRGNKTVAALVARPTVITVPQVRRASRRSGRMTHRRAGRAGRAILTKASRVARDEKHTFAAVGAAIVLGMLKKYGMLARLPHIASIGVSGTYGLGLWLLNRQGILGGQMSAHVATGLLSVSAYQMAAGETTIAGEDEGDL